MLLYLTKTTLFLLLSLGLYKLLLENKKIHQFKRYYLLFTLILALVLPIIEIPSTSALTIANTKLQELNEVIISTQSNPIETTSSFFSWFTFFLFIYGLGVLVMTGKLITSLNRFRHLQKQGSMVYNRGQKFVLLSSIDAAFTFRQTIYLPLHIPIDWTNKIIQHEYNHVKQHHSFDILLLEWIKILFWFHPLIYVYQENMALNHEFLADDVLNANEKEVQDYLQLLLHQTYQQNEHRLSSSFNFNLTKKRFIMLTKQNNPVQNTWAVFGAVILLLTLSTYTVLAQDKPKSPIADSTYSATQDEVHIAVTNPAGYPGGMQAFNQDFISNFFTPEFEGTSARVILMFIVEKDGSLSDLKVVRDPGFGIKEAALAALAKTSNWIPAQHHGELVRSQFTLPITIQKPATEKTTKET